MGARSAIRRGAWLARRLGVYLHVKRVPRMTQVPATVDIGGVLEQVPLHRQIRNSVSSIVTDQAARPLVIWAVGMVKNEADIIEECVLNFLDQGVDSVLVADHGSTDGTLEILERLATTRPVHVASVRTKAFWQADTVSYLSRVATRAGATWIVAFDADEIWRGTEGRTLRECLDGTSAKIARGTWYQYLPIEAETDRTSVVERFPYRKPDPDVLPKVAFRANYLAFVIRGNHDVSLPNPTYEQILRIAHYRYRSPEQMVQKARDGTAGLSAGGRQPYSAKWPGVANLEPAEARLKFDEHARTDNTVMDPVSLW